MTPSRTLTHHRPATSVRRNTAARPRPAEVRLRLAHRHALAHELGRASRARSRRGLLDNLRAVPHWLASETHAGLLVILFATIALVWANSPLRGLYDSLSSTVVGPASLHLDLTVASWASDGLLAIFFFVVGLELKQEFVVGSLRDLRQAALPMVAAVFGMAGPAAVYVVVQLLADGDLEGWAVPTATDIAFAMAILSIFGRGMPPAARTFLLTLAVVDDLLAIIVIAVFYSHGFHGLALVASLAVVAVFAWLVRRGTTHWYLLVPLGVAAWVLMHASGIHATLAGVALGLVVPARPTRREPTGMTARFTHLVHPVSAGIALPLFALFAAGVNVTDTGGLREILTDPVAIGIYLGLPLGKILGIWGSVTFLSRTTPLRLGHGLDAPDVFALSAVTGIGFTVALLIAGLAFGEGAATTDHARAAVILGTGISAVLGAVLLRRRVTTPRRGPGAQRG